MVAGGSPNTGARHASPLGGAWRRFPLKRRRPRRGGPGEATRPARRPPKRKAAPPHNAPSAHPSRREPPVRPKARACNTPSPRQPSRAPQPRPHLRRRRAAPGRAPPPLTSSQCQPSQPPPPLRAPSCPPRARSCGARPTLLCAPPWPPTPWPPRPWPAWWTPWPTACPCAWTLSWWAPGRVVRQGAVRCSPVRPALPGRSSRRRACLSCVMCWTGEGR